MGEEQYISAQQPLGKFLSGTGRKFLNALNVKLRNLDIERNFYALILIEEGDGKMTQQGLAELLESDKVSVVRIINYLSNAGYVKREKDPSDKRKYRLNLTPKAEKEIPDIKKAIEVVTQKAFNGLSGEKIEELYKTLNIIRYNLNLQRLAI
jgi:MarR family transcriptional regulator, transcriptional regulator for hemolysin